MLIAVIRSMEMQRDRGEGTSGDFGFFELEVEMEEKLLNLDPSPRDTIIRRLAMDAAGLVEAHGIPLFLWTAHISPRARALTNLPEKVDFK